ncbi:MAG TPA: hypothetical protein VGF08_04285, partial [Terriglobales bacterium]
MKRTDADLHMMRRRLIALFLACTFLPAVAYPADPKGQNAILWRDPGDIEARNLFYGAGGQQHQPHGDMVFVKEDHAGTNPKFDVRDHEGTRWTAKLGVEAKPEIAAAHLLWAMGYFTDEDYFVPTLSVERMPKHLARGQELIDKDGTIRGVRLERRVMGLKKDGHWKWKHNVFSGTREFNGLRVMMALLNNWDLKDENNAIYRGGTDEPAIYAVSDLGATFGTTGYNWTAVRSKGNLEAYRRSKFISKVTADYVDFNVPTRPAFLYAFNFPAFIMRMRLRGI